MQLAIIFFTSALLVLGLGRWLYQRYHLIQLKKVPSLNTLKVREFEVVYQRQGAGPYVLLLHGIGASHYCWRLLIPHLAARYTVLAPDLPGFGMSSKITSAQYGLDEQAHRIRQFLDLLDIPQCRVVGCSMGGALALWLARQDPHRFFEVAALAPATDPKILPLDFARLKALAPVFRLGVSESLVRGIMKRVNSNPAVITEEAVKAYTRPYYNDSRAIHTFFAATELLRDSRLPEGLKGLQARTLILWGAKENLVSRLSMDKLRETLPHAEYYEHPEGGHHLMEDDPHWTAKILFSFFGNMEI